MKHEELLVTVADGIAHGEYSLLLGAGASLGAVGGNGEPLPTGLGLRNALVSTFEIDSSGESISLARAYEHARRRDRSLLRSNLLEWFTGCRPTWQGLLAEFFWHRIWTLNIDDVLEQAFEQRGHPYRAYGWRERFKDRDIAHLEQIIHLHGAAAHLAEADPDDGALIFSLTEYARTVADPDSWHRVFFDEFAERPFVVIGASLVEEFDLVEALNHGTATEAQTGYPSVVVLPSVTPLQREELQATGVRVVESDGERFIRDLVEHYRKTQETLRNAYGKAVSPDVARFLQQFVDLRSHRPRRGTETHKFYAGYKPSWDTILADDDAWFETTGAASTAACESAIGEDVVQEIHILHGGPGTGKSTALLRLASDLMSVGARPFLFREDEDLDVEAALRWLRIVPRTILLIDDCAFFASSMQELAEQCRSANVRMIAVVAERSSRLRIIRDRIGAEFLRPDPPWQFGGLSDADIESLLRKLHSRGRLGRITRLSEQEQRQYFVRAAGRRLFDGMAELEGGKGFRETVQRDYRALRDVRLQHLYAAASIAYALGVVLPTGIGIEIAGIPASELNGIVEREAADVLVFSPEGLRPPHRVTASMVVQSALSADVRFGATLSLTKALAPHVDIQAIANVTRPYRLARQLMDMERVVGYVGPDRAREWFGLIREDYSWNGRYWEQRALLESYLGDNSAARSYAERSIKIHAHPFAFNTLGTILLRIAIEDGDVKELISGIDNLESARDWRQWNPSEHPYVTFFTSVLRFAQKWGLRSIPEKVRAKWTHWYGEAAGALPFSHSDAFNQLQEWQRGWLLLVTQGTSDSE